MAKTNLITEPGKREIVMTRVFDAPRELVFKACTDPKLMPQLWGLKSLAITVDKIDVRPGGAWRFVQRGPDGKEYAFIGVYRKIVPPDRLVCVFEFEGMPGHLLIEMLTFKKHNRKTKLTVTSLFQTVEDRDRVLQSGIKARATESFDCLNAFVAKKVRDTL